MRRLCLVLLALCLFPRMILAAPSVRQGIQLVRTFYKPDYKQETMPLSARLKRLLELTEAHSHKIDAPVAGLDFVWTANAQDAEPGWEKSARFSTTDNKPGRSTVRVTFRNNKREGDLRYSLVAENGHWTVDDIRSMAGERWILSQMLIQGAKEH